VSGYAYITNSAAQVVSVGADVTFDNSSVLTSDFAHAAGSSTITINAAGTFALWFSVSGVEPNQFAVAQNGVAIASSRYGSGAGTQQTTGMTIVTLAAGDVLSLRNSSSAAAVTLQALAGGTEANINASIMIQKLD